MTQWSVFGGGFSSPGGLADHYYDGCKRETSRTRCLITRALCIHRYDSLLISLICDRFFFFFLISMSLIHPGSCEMERALYVSGCYFVGKA